MKYIIIVILGLIISFDSNQLIAQEKTKDNFTVKVDGLGCPFCAYGLEKKFKELKGIDDVSIEMETGIFTFTFPTKESLTVEKVESQVDAAGYTAIKVDVVRADGSSESTTNNNTIITDASNEIEESIFVGGNCDMCKARIEKTASKVAGVTSAEWDKKSKTLRVKFDKTQTAINEIAEAIAAAGHDTKLSKADSATYDDLPGCCHYDRIN